jgi:hypothetical protein
MTRAEEIRRLREALEQRGVYVGAVWTCWLPLHPMRDLTLYLSTRTAYGPGSWQTPDLSGPRYRGRGWVERLADDVAAWLRRTA